MDESQQDLDLSLSKPDQVPPSSLTSQTAKVPGRSPAHNNDEEAKSHQCRQKGQGKGAAVFPATVDDNSSRSSTGEPLHGVSRASSKAFQRRPLEPKITPDLFVTAEAEAAAKEAEAEILASMKTPVDEGEQPMLEKPEKSLPRTAPRRITTRTVKTNVSRSHLEVDEKPDSADARRKSTRKITDTGTAKKKRRIPRSVGTSVDLSDVPDQPPILKNETGRYHDNTRKRRVKADSSRFMGVYWEKETTSQKRYKAQIYVRGKGVTSLGYYASEEEAAKVYAKAAYKFKDLNETSVRGIEVYGGVDLHGLPDQPLVPSSRPGSKSK